MTIGIIGAGNIGTAFAKALGRAGIGAIISNSRGPDTLKELAREAGPHPRRHARGSRRAGHRAGRGELNGRVSSEVFATLVPGARVVKAFNHLQPPLLSGDPKAEGGRRVLFFSGDDNRAKGAIGALIDRLGFFGIDLGSLSVGGRLVQFPGGPLPVHNLVRFG